MKETISVICDLCGIQYKAHESTDGMVQLASGDDNCRCGGTEFSTWTEKMSGDQPGNE